MKTLENNITAKTNSKNNSIFFQPKLTINNPNDAYEQEADSIAEQVIRKPINKNENYFFKPVNISSIKSNLNVNRKCAECEEEEKLQRKENGNSEVEASSELQNYVGGLNTGGNELPNNVRNFFEPKFGYDFSNVRVHNDPIAAKSAQSINALAYTSGNNIIFDQGQYSPETDSGKKLLGHELTHVVQQSGSDGICVEPHPVLRRQQAPGSPAPTTEQMREIELRQLAMLPHLALKQWKTLTQSKRDQVLMNMQLSYGAPFTSDFLNYAKGVKKSKPGLAGTLKGPEYTAKWLFNRGYRHAYGEIWVRPSGEYLMVLPPSQTKNEVDKEKPIEKREETYEYGGVTYYKSGKVATYPKSMENRCWLVCQDDAKNEEECSDCCVEKIPASDPGCLNFCISSCEDYYR